MGFSKKSRRAPVVSLDALEHRLLLTNVGGPILVDTTWTKANSPYVLTADVFVRQGATLDVEPGVVIRSSASTNELYVSDDGSGGTLNLNGLSADKVQVENQLILGGATAGALGNVNFTASSGVTLDAGNGTALGVSNTAFNGEVIVHPEFVPNLPLNGNTFAPNRIVQLIGGRMVDAATTWPAIPNVSRYEIRNTNNFGNPESVYVRGGATLTIAPGVTVTSQQPDFDRLVVGDDGTGGRLVVAGTPASRATLRAQTFIQANATADVRYADVTDAFQVNGTGHVVLDHVAFANTSAVTLDVGNETPLDVTNTAFEGTVIVHPELVPALPLNGNTFAPNRIVQLIGGRVVDADTTWPVIPNVSRYEIRNTNNFGNPESIFVRAGAALTVAAGATVTSQQPDFDQLVVGDTGTGGRLVLAGTAALPVGLQAWASIQANASADVRYASVSGAFNVTSTDTVALDHVTFANTSTVTLDAGNGTPVTVANTAFNGIVIVHPEFVPNLPLNGNAFAPNRVVQLIGGRTVDADTAWPVIPNVSRYEIRNTNNFGNPESVYVRAGATLTVAAGVTVVSQQPDFDQIVAGDLGNGGRLVIAGTAASPVSLQAWAAIQGNAAADVRYANVSGAFNVASTDSVLLDHVAFANTSAVLLNADKGTPLTVANTAFNGGLTVHPEFVPALPLGGNTFAPNRVVQLVGSTAIDADTTWPAIPNVSRYEIRNTNNFGNPESVYVRGGATLTIAPGVTVTSQQPDFDRLVVGDNGTGGRLVAIDATMNAQVFVGSGGGIRFRYVTENALLQLNSGASVDVHLSDFSAGTATVESIGNAAVPIDLRDNYWGFTTAALIEANKLVDNSDTPPNSRPEIVFDPFLTATPLDRTAPVLAASFDYRAPQALHLVFSEDVRASLAAGDFVLTNRTLEQDVPLTGLAWDDPYDTSATIVFDGPARLADGEYRLTRVGPITDPSGNGVAEFSFDFFVLAGDANRDRHVNFADLLALAKNYGKAGTWSQGDFTGDGNVDFADLLVLAKSYNKSVPVPGAIAVAAPAPSAAVAPSVLRDEAAARPVFSTTRVVAPTPAPARPVAAARPVRR